MFSINPVEAAEILELLSIPAYEYNDNKKFHKINEILEYFHGDANKRVTVLKVLQGKPGDRLDVLWEYVALQKARREKVSQLNPEDFEPDIAAELSQKYLSKSNLKRVKEDMAKRIQEREKQKAKQAEKRFEEKTEKVMDKVDEYAAKLAEIEQIDKQIDLF